MNLSGILAFAGALLILLGVFGVASLLTVPGWPLILLGVVLVVLSMFTGRMENPWR